MKSEEELLELLKNEGFYSYRVHTTETEITHTLQLTSMEDLLDFSCKHKIDTMFYSYNLIDKDVLSITDETTSQLKLGEDELLILQEKFDEYNDRLSEVDYSKPVALNVYCIYQGVIFFIQEEDYWFLEQGFGMPETVCIELATENFEDILKEKEKRKQNINEGRKDLRQQILNDEEFHRCTNQELRRQFANKMFRSNSVKQQLFYSEKEGLYDISINSFVEDIWREYKSSLKKHL
ncbi:hypothetical protein [Desulfosporosinus hippei]|uniref:Uncharacterized protein n=1 Tax=Desulfosporosinus hippei DSM 8344 TaxID=1121419 RepID=A0A1G7Z4Q8_9FIRM|nr:hypothetical protein [Desulfosporosinus hippei]SDH03752.1 hypothetical protein SAMN05443529_1099 [Desulfosporosinus hippei DSM 8344]